MRYLRYSRVRVEELGKSEGTTRVTVPGNRLRVAGVVVLGAVAAPLIGIGLAIVGGLLGDCERNPACKYQAETLSKQLFPVAGGGCSSALAC